MFTAGFLNNLGNYRSFGDTKIVPVIGKEDLHKLIAASEAYKLDSALVDKLWSAASDRLYSLNPGDKQLGFPPQVSCESDFEEYLATFKVCFFCIAFISKSIQHSNSC